MVARDAEGPQSRLPLAIRRECRSVSAQCGTGIEQRRQECLYLFQVGRRQVEAVEFQFSANAGFVKRARDHTPGLIAMRHHHCLFTRTGRQRDKGNLSRCMGLKVDFLAEGHDRIQSSAGSSGEPITILAQGGGRAERLTSTQETCTVGFTLAGDFVSRRHYRRMGQVNGLFARRTGTAMKQQRVRLGHVLAFDEQFIESRVARVGDLSRQDDFAVARQ